MTYAEPPGSCVCRKSAVASADVQIDSSGTWSPLRERRAARSRGVKIELLVRTRKRRCFSTSRSRNSAAPGSAFSSCTSTPSMSVSQHSGGTRSVVMARTLARSEEHTSELQSRQYLVCRLLLEKKKNTDYTRHNCSMH